MVVVICRSVGLFAAEQLLPAAPRLFVEAVDDGIHEALNDNA